LSPGSCITTGQSTWQPVLARHPGSNSPRQNAHFIIAVKNNTQVEVTVGCGCDSAGAHCGNGFYLVGSMTAGIWHHVAVTFNGDNSTTATASLYLDGVNVDNGFWGSVDTQCLGRPARWAAYAPVKVGFLDDSATTPASSSNPNDYLGWWGMIDEIRFWFGVRTAAQIQTYRDIALSGYESGLFAYYPFSPSEDELMSPTSTKVIANEVGDYLHGLPQPNPTDAGIFAQSSTLHLGFYSIIEGQSDHPDLPPLPNNITFGSWPQDNETVYHFPASGYSVALNNLLNNPNIDASLYTSADGKSATLFIDCLNNDCSTYTNNWKDYYLDYTATLNGVTSGTGRQYLQIVTSCPSGQFDECGTCDGDNSQCQCVVYHGFQSERMTFILFEWSLHNLMSEVLDTLTVIAGTQNALAFGTMPSNGELRQQISDLMNFYNMELTPYCGDVQDFTNSLSSAVPKASLTAIDESAFPDVDGSIPFVPSFVVDF